MEITHHQSVEHGSLTIIRYEVIGYSFNSRAVGMRPIYGFSVESMGVHAFIMTVNWSEL